MRDVLIKEGISTFIIVNIDGVDTIAYLKDCLPIDRVVTLDNNNYVYLYDKCFKVDESDIERVL